MAWCSLPDGLAGVTGDGFLPLAVAEFAEFAELAEAVTCGLEVTVEIGSWPTTTAHMSRKAYTASFAIA